MARSSTNGNSKYVDPRQYQGILGSTFATQSHRPLITIGPRSWNKWQLGRLGCPHPSAAVRIQRVLETLRITTTKEFIARASEFGRFENIGVTCYWVVLALVADCGGDIEEAHGEEKSFNAIHHAALKAMQPTPADKTVRGPSENPAKGKARRRKQ